MEDIYFCECGCGAPTRRGRGKRPNRYIRGHNSKRGQGNGWINQGHRYRSVGGRVVAEHRLIAERTLGRSLEPGEVVHHVDGDPLNNSPENLQVMGRGEHLVHHLRRMPVHPFSREDMVVVLGLRAAGMTIDQIANELDRSYFSIRRRLQRTNRRPVEPEGTAAV